MRKDNKASRREMSNYISIESGCVEDAVGAAALRHFEKRCRLAGHVIPSLDVRLFYGRLGLVVEAEAIVEFGLSVPTLIVAPQLLGSCGCSQAGAGPVPVHAVVTVQPKPSLESVLFVEAKTRVREKDVRGTLRRMAALLAHLVDVARYLDRCETAPGKKAEADAEVLALCLAAATAKDAATARSQSGTRAAVDAAAAAEKLDAGSKKAAAFFTKNALRLERALMGNDLARLHVAAAAGAAVAQVLDETSRDEITGEELRRLKAAGLDTLTSFVRGYLGGKSFPTELRNRAVQVGLHAVAIVDNALVRD